MSIAMRVARVQRRPARGDPGLGSFLGGIGKFVGGLGIPVVSGIAGAVGGLLSPQQRPQQAIPSPLAVPRAMPGSGTVTVGGTTLHLPGGAPGVGLTTSMGTQLGFGFGPGTAVAPTMNGNGRPAGMRLNKSSYFLRSGEFVPAGTRFVKARRRNPLNPRALSRAMSRLTSAKRAASAMQRISIRPAKSCR